VTILEMDLKLLLNILHRVKKQIWHFLYVKFFIIFNFNYFTVVLHSFFYFVSNVCLNT